MPACAFDSAFAKTKLAASRSLIRSAAFCGYRTAFPRKIEKIENAPPLSTNHRGCGAITKSPLKEGALAARKICRGEGVSNIAAKGSAPHLGGSTARHWEELKLISLSAIPPADLRKDPQGLQAEALRIPMASICRMRKISGKKAERFFAKSPLRAGAPGYRENRRVATERAGT
jgi:hypothetical protein